MRSDHDLSAETYPGAILGFRGWVFEGGRLTSLTRREITWESSVQSAECVKLQADWSTHPAPDPECSCGLYAHHSPDPWESGTRGRMRDRETIVGAVAGSGRAFIYGDGFRSERMQILGLLEPEMWMPTVSLTRLRRRYGVPILSSMRELSSWAREFATPCCAA